MGGVASARTLREMAQSSNALLVQDCGFDDSKISKLSQKLKAEIDQKLTTLTSRDYKLIEERAKICEQDCSCDIYALALEKKQISVDELNAKAAKITTDERKTCAAKLSKAQRCSKL